MKVLTTLAVLFTYYACYGITSSSDEDTDSTDIDEEQETKTTFTLETKLKKYSDKEFDDKFRRMKLDEKPKRTPLPPSFTKRKDSYSIKQATQRPESDPSSSQGSGKYNTLPEGATGYTEPTPQGACGYTEPEPKGASGYSHGYGQSQYDQGLRGSYPSTQKIPPKIPSPPKFSLNPPYYPPVIPPPGYQPPRPEPSHYPVYGQGQSGRSPIVIPPPGKPPIVPCTGCGPAGAHGGHVHHQSYQTPGLYDEIEQGIAKREDRRHPEPKHIKDLKLNTKDKDSGRHIDFESTYGPNGHIAHIFRPGDGYLFSEVCHKEETLWRGEGMVRAIEVWIYNVGFPNKKALIILNNGTKLYFKKKKTGWIKEDSLKL